MRRSVLAVACVALLAGCDSNVAAQSHAFAQAAKRICATAARKTGVPPAARDRRRLAAWARAARAELLRERARLAALREPPNIHRALARVELHTRRVADALGSVARDAAAEPSKLHADLGDLAAERKGAVLAAHLLNVKECLALPQVP